MLESVCTYHIDVLLECFDNRTLGMIDKAREGDSMGILDRLPEKQQSSVFMLFEVTQSTAARRGKASSHHRRNEHAASAGCS